MSLNKLFKTLAVFLITLFIYTPISYSGFTMPDTDNTGSILLGFFDLRDRDSYFQITNVASSNSVLHVQIFDVSNNCNENNFYDIYTPNDTHTYNLKDISTNDGNPSGIVLPQNSYGFVSVGVVESIGGDFTVDFNIIGNFRIVDVSGYEYRTNITSFPVGAAFFTSNITLNFNTKGNVTLSDVVGIAFRGTFSEGEVFAADISNIYFKFGVDITNDNEVIFSCRDVVFACTDQDNPLLEELLEQSEVNVASFEYGINNSIPHSKGGELLCPGNIIEEGVVLLNNFITTSDTTTVYGYVGLNNGNGRGSMDSWWHPNQNVLEPDG